MNTRIGGGGILRAITTLLGVLTLTLGFASPGLAQVPPAGAVIGNQASATYTDASGTQKTATSNLVETTVQQVGSFTLTSDNTKTAAVGNTVYMPHTLTNTGNGTDSFSLALTDNAGTFAASGIAIYADANGDGVPDSTTALCAAPCAGFTTPNIASGGVYRFLVSMAVPGTAAASSSDTVTVTATATNSSLYTSASVSNTDTLTVTNGASFQVAKSVSLSQGATGAQLTYTLTYTNIGGAAGNLALQDVIGSSATAGLSYVAGSALWSAGNAALGDNAYAAGTPDATVGGMVAHYEAVTASNVTTIRANISNVAPNVSGTVVFRVNVLAGATVGSASTSNTALFGTDADTNPTNNTLAQSTNAAVYSVLASYGVVFNNNTTSATDGGNTAAGADLSTVATAAPGGTITFNSNVVWNTGTATDTFNITVQSPGTFPAGTTFQLFKADGATPLLDTNGDGRADTGPIAPNTSYVVVVKATLPTTVCSSGCPTGPFTVQLTATSAGDSTKTNLVFDQLTAIAAPGVDIANTTGTTSAGNLSPVGGTASLTNTVLPGQSTILPVYIGNEGAASDSYELSYAGNAGFTAALPAGWTVEFRTSTNGSCTTTGSVITSVGPLAASSETLVCAVVAAPAGSLAGTTSVYIKATSLVTGATDTVFDAVTVQAVNSITLAPSNTGQAYPGGTVVYAHTLTNTGNTSCGSTFTFTLSQSLASQGWSFVVYQDANSNGALDTDEPALGSSVNSLILAPGAQYKVLVKVFAPAGAASGSADVVTLTVSSNCNGTTVTTTNSVSDTTTVVTGQIRLVKSQALDAACDGTADAAFTTGAISGGVKPGQCLVYQIVATNEGLGTVTGLSITDALPAYTTSTGAPIPASAGGFNPSCMTMPASTQVWTAGTLSASSFSCSGLSLAPSKSATLLFTVKVLGN